MKQDVLYDVVAAKTPKELAEIVNAGLKQGWELVGGVSCAATVDRAVYESIFLQAVIRPKTN